MTCWSLVGQTDDEIVGSVAYRQPTVRLRYFNGNWTTRGYANSRTEHLADWTTRGLADAAKRTKTEHAVAGGIREMSSPRVVQSASWRIRELSSNLCRYADIGIGIAPLVYPYL